MPSPSPDTAFPHPVTGILYPAVWRDKAGVLHRAVGAWMHCEIRLMWTACGKKDIPANRAWLQTAGDEVTCAACIDEVCPRCEGTGAIDAPFSGSDPSCPDCDGEGTIPHA